MLDVGVFLLMQLQITPAQVQFLMTLGVDKEVIRRLTKQQASDMITKKLVERDAQPPIGPQLQLLTVSDALASSQQLLLTVMIVVERAIQQTYSLQ